jgi:hypothetical protein
VVICPSLGASEAFDIPAFRLRHRDHDIVAEGIERRPFFVLIGAAVIDTRNARLVAADVVYHRLNDMRLYSSIGYPCARCSPKVM